MEKRTLKNLWELIKALWIIWLGVLVIIPLLALYVYHFIFKIPLLVKVYLLLNILSMILFRDNTYKMIIATIIILTMTVALRSMLCCN